MLNIEAAGLRDRTGFLGGWWDGDGMGPSGAEQSIAQQCRELSLSRSLSRDKETVAAVALQCCIPVATVQELTGVSPD